MALYLAQSMIQMLQRWRHEWIQNHEEDGAAGMQGVSIFQLRTQNGDAYTPFPRSPLCLLFIMQTHYATAHKNPFHDTLDRSMPFLKNIS